MPYELFTDRARKVMKLAEQEARRFNHDCIGTEHLLLGLVKEGGGAGAHVLKEFGLDLEKLRAETEKRVAAGPKIVTAGMPLTPRLKSVVEFAHDEAWSLGHKYIGTEHLLLGLTRESEGIAFDILSGLDIEFYRLREKTLEVLDVAVPGPEKTGFTDTPPTLEDVGKYFAIKRPDCPDEIYIGILAVVFPRRCIFVDPNDEEDGIDIQVWKDTGCEFCVLDCLPRCERVVEAARERRERKFRTEGGAE